MARPVARSTALQKAERRRSTMMRDYHPPLSRLNIASMGRCVAGRGFRIRRCLAYPIRPGRIVLPHNEGTQIPQVLFACLLADNPDPDKRFVVCEDSKGREAWIAILRSVGRQHNTCAES